ncbi:MAG: helix-turn-helix transcriptional regulator [Solirubrobacterales bacterium]
MNIANEMTDQAVIAELGKRIAKTRLSRNLSQEALATQAGVSTLTVHNIEAGKSSQLRNLLRVLRVLGLLPALDLLIPDSGETPLQQLERERRHGARVRAGRRHQKTHEPVRESWKWGDE